MTSSSSAPDLRTPSPPAGSTPAATHASRCSLRSTPRGASTAGPTRRRPCATSRGSTRADRRRHFPGSDGLDGVSLPEAGEAAARRRWRDFTASDLDDYDTARDEPGTDRTSRMSVHLRWGEIHPRTLLADLGRSNGAEAYRRELAFREFYADVLDRRPDSAWGYYDRDFEAMQYDEPGGDLEAWKAGSHRLPDRRRRHASAPRRGMDAQPRADDRGELPRQGSAPGVAARSTPLRRAPRGLRPGLQPARVAVGGRVRHRRRAVLPGLQPDDARQEVRSGRYVRAAMGS